MFIEKKKHAVFPTLIMTFDLSDHPHYNRVLDVVEKTKTGSHLIMRNSESSYDERTDNVWLNHMLLREFKDTLQGCIDEYTKHYGLKQVHITNSWMNKVGVGGAVKPHRHELSVVSGAFYPIADEGSCSLLFRSPITPYRMNEFLVTENEYNMANQSIECKQGELILFPSWLEHFTDENTTENRVTVSFNTRYG